MTGPSDAEPIDALAWLRERGIAREPIHVAPPPQGPPPQPREVANLASPPATHPAVPAPPPPPGAEAGHGTPDGVPRAQDPVPAPLGDEVAKALAFVRRSTSTTVQSRGRLAAKLAERGTPDVVARQALERAEAEGLVADQVVLPALVEERRALGHAPRRIRDDLVDRGFAPDDVDAALAPVEEADPHAAAFGLARDRAAGMSGLAPETAYRRVAAWLARRGYPEAVARKAARDAVWTDREAARVAGH